jgi:UDP-N-acetylglucosamine--N-acetylmuramyl-(pentapeptide) pyrophosphoryl-undecaprenol N-acetylglucosamine transferase
MLPAGRLGKNPLHWPKGIGAILEGRAWRCACSKAFQPSAVVGFGGYPALPGAAGGDQRWRAERDPRAERGAGPGQPPLAGRVDAIATAYREVERLKPKHATRSIWSAIRCAPKCWRCAMRRSRRSAKTACCACW